MASSSWRKLIIKPGGKNTACHPRTGTVFIDYWQRFHVCALETLGALVFTDAQWFQLVITSLIGPQQQNHSFSALLGAFLGSKELFAAICNTVLFHHSCTIVHQCTHHLQLLYGVFQESSAPSLSPFADLPSMLFGVSHVELSVSKAAHQKL
jgi:hypothetical protein